MPYFWKKQKPNLQHAFYSEGDTEQSWMPVPSLIILTKMDLDGESHKNEHDSCKISIFLWFYGLVRSSQKKQLISSNNVRQTDENMFSFV